MTTPPPATGAPNLDPPAAMPDGPASIWREVVTAHLEAGDLTITRKIGHRLEAYCAIAADLRDAAQRVDHDGLLIQDARGQGSPHPAIAIKNDASRELARYGDEFRPKPPRTGRRGGA